MPAESKSQRRLFGACEHGADFPECSKMRKSMTHEQMHDFAKTPEKGLPGHKKPHGFHIIIAIKPKK